MNRSIVIVLSILGLAWYLWVFSYSPKKEVKNSIEGIVSSVETRWTQVDKLSGSVYVPEATVVFTKPEKKVELRAIFVTDFGDYWGDAHGLTMDVNQWEKESSLTIQGSRGLKRQGDLVAFQEQRVPPIQLWIFDKSNQTSEPLIKIPILN